PRSGGVEHEGRLPQVVQGHARGHQVELAAPRHAIDLRGVHHAVVDGVAVQTASGIDLPFADVHAHDGCTPLRQLATAPSLAAAEIERAQPTNISAGPDQRRPMDVFAMNVEAIAYEVAPFGAREVPAPANVVVGAVWHQPQAGRRDHTPAS